MPKTIADTQCNSSRRVRRGSLSVKSSSVQSAKAKPPVEESEVGQITTPEFIDRFRVSIGSGADVYYQADFIDDAASSSLYSDLAALNTWYHPTLKIYGKSIQQSRAVAVYSINPGMTVKYSGQVVNIHHPYPPFLQEIQQKVESALGTTFNHVMLNRYDDGTVYIGKHNDNVENKVIASLSIGAERTFIMSPRHERTGRTRRWTLKNGSLLVMQGDTQHNWKHEIPKEPKVKGGRISLTFRQLVKP